MANLRRAGVVMRIGIVWLLWCLSAAVMAAPSMEEDRWYEVEIILFTVAQSEEEAPVGAERWPEDPGAPEVSDAIELAPALESLMETTVSGTPVQSEDEIGLEVDGGTDARSLVVPYQLLPRSAHRLTVVESRLALAEEFTPILHLAWRQPAFPRRTPGTAVRIQWREENEGGDAVPAVDERLVVPPSSGLFGGELFRGGPARRAAARLDGTITVSVNRYLHLEADLLYDSGEIADEGGLFSIFSAAEGERTPHRFRMQQKRRLRSGELHYFDHPRFGLLALITPFEYPRPPTAAADSEGGDQVP